jgi:transposase
MTPRGRMIMIERIGSGRPIAHVAAEMGVSRKTADKWWRRWLSEGEDGLEDRSSRPHRCPHQTASHLERRIVKLRQRRKLGPARIASIVGVPASTVHRVLCRHGLNRLAWMDRPTGQVIRRIHTDRPGELVHVDVKKLGGSHPAADGVSMAEATPRTIDARRSVTTSFTPRSTRTADSPTARSSPTSRVRPAPRSGTAPSSSSTHTRSPSKRS